MSAPVETAAPDGHAVPFGLRVAASLCAVVGVVSVASTLAIGVPRLRAVPDAWVILAINLSASVAVCAAAVLAWRRRRLAVALLIAGWALPTVATLAAGNAPKLPSLFMVLALLALLGNYHELR